MRSGDHVRFESPVCRIETGEKYDAATRIASRHSKFANGAATAAMTSLFSEAGRSNSGGRALTADEQRALKASARVGVCFENTSPYSAA